MSELGNVVQLVNRLQGACTLLGDNAASDSSLPGLWDLLPSIVVIGGQVRGRGSLASHVNEAPCCRGMCLCECLRRPLAPPSPHPSVSGLVGRQSSVHEDGPNTQPFAGVISLLLTLTERRCLRPRAEFGQVVCAGGGGRARLPAPWHRHRHQAAAGPPAGPFGRHQRSRLWRVPPHGAAEMDGLRWVFLAALNLC